jgi:hypothetical protein
LYKISLVVGDFDGIALAVGEFNIAASSFVGDRDDFDMQLAAIDDRFFPDREVIGLLIFFGGDPPYPRR